MALRILTCSHSSTTISCKHYETLSKARVVIVKVGGCSCRMCSTWKLLEVWGLQQEGSGEWASWATMQTLPQLLWFWKPSGMASLSRESWMSSLDVPSMAWPIELAAFLCCCILMPYVGIYHIMLSVNLEHVVASLQSASQETGLEESTKLSTTNSKQA